MFFVGFSGSVCASLAVGTKQKSTLGAPIWQVDNVPSAYQCQLHAIKLGALADVHSWKWFDYSDNNVASGQRHDHQVCYMYSSPASDTPMSAPMQSSWTVGDLGTIISNVRASQGGGEPSRFLVAGETTALTMWGTGLADADAARIKVVREDHFHASQEDSSIRNGCSAAAAPELLASLASVSRGSRN